MTDEKRFESVSRPLEDWLLEPGKLAVADYQRAYAWSESLATGFAEDICQAVFADEPQLVDVGVVVIEHTKEDDVIADGQQRLMTFALLMLELLGSSVPKQQAGVAETSRLSSLLQGGAGNLETVIHARRMRRLIRNVAARFLPAPSAQEKLKNVTFSIASFDRPAGSPSDPAIAQFFEEINTRAKPLNGGQILKAYHMGRIRRHSPKETWAAQAAFEAWFREKQRVSEFSLKAFAPFSFNTGEPLTLEAFIDSPDQDAWYKLGAGFVQAVQSILLKENDWWHQISQQGEVRRQPFERLEGIPREQAGDGPLEEWSAKNPLEFSDGEGFFRLVARFGRLYQGFCCELLKRPDLQDWPLSKISMTDAAASLLEADAAPGKLVCKALGHLVNVGRVLIRCCGDDPAKLGTPAVSRLCTYEDGKPVKIIPGLETSGYWLGFQGPGEAASNSFGCLAAAVFAVALCWCDRFRIRPDSPDAQRLVQILAYMLFMGRSQATYRSVLNVFSAEAAVSAAEFTLNPGIAHWRFFKTAYRRSELTSWLRELEKLFDELLGISEDGAAPMKDLTDEERASLTLMKGAISTYLSF